MLNLSNMITFAKIEQFLREVHLELNKVKWPTRQETVKLTLVVIGISVILGIYIGGLDFILTKMIELLIRK